MDLYNVDGKIYCGEMTFNPDGGYAKFLDKNIDYKIGEMIDLSKIEPEYLVNDWQEIFAKYDSRL